MKIAWLTEPKKDFCPVLDQMYGADNWRLNRGFVEYRQSHDDPWSNYYEYRIQTGVAYVYDPHKR